MSGIEVVACVAAVVSAFHGGAELITIIKDKRSHKKEKRDRRRKERLEREMEQFFQEKMLHTSLQDGEHRVQEHYELEQRQLGYAFRRGDDIATSQLKDVVINMQGEIIRSLQIAVSFEQAELDLSKLHEASITNRMSAERSMDDLRERIILTLPVPRQLEDHTARGQGEGFEYEGYLSRMPTLRRRGSNDSVDSFQTAEADFPAAVTIPGGQPGRHLSVHRPFTNNGRTRSDGAVQRAASRVSIAWRLPSIRKHDNDIMTLRGLRMHDNDDAESRIQEYSSEDDPAENFRAVDMHTGRSVGAETQPDPPARPSNSLSTASSSTGAPTAGPSSNQTHPRPREASVSIGPSSDRAASIASNETSSTNNPSTPSTSEASSTRSNPSVVASPHLSATMTHFEIARAQRAYSAPEVVPPPMNKLAKHYSHPTQRRPQDPQKTVPFKDPSRPWLGVRAVPWIGIQTNPSPKLTPSISRSLTDPWLPLAKPSKENNFHNYCRGSWLARSESPKDGISIALVPTSGSFYTNIPHWQCKKCDFKSEGLPANPSPIPNKILFASSGLRYRWLFLLKSHAKCKDQRTTTENYSYGCIFCTAEGRATATYGGLKTLVEHILARHPRGEMTQEVLAKTRTVVGRVAESEDDGWDVNFPEVASEIGEGEDWGSRGDSVDAITAVA